MIGSNSSIWTPFRQLLPGTSAVYCVPPFQRDYAWTNDQWDDLWRDLESLAEARETSGNAAMHYMGYLVLKPDSPGRPSGEGDIWVIDGQQRLATITILALACAERFGRLALEQQGKEKEENKAREETVRREIIGRTDIVTQRPVRRLRLNRNDDRFFEDILAGVQPISFVQRKRSNRLLWEALEFFRGKVADKEGEDAARLVDAVNGGLAFSVMHFEDELDAYQVFETLNARGMLLSQGDLVKNLLFRMAASEGKAEEMDPLWDDMEVKVGGDGMVDFLRHFWNSRRELARADNFYRFLRDGVHNAADAFEFLGGAQRKAESYQVLQTPFEWRNDKDAQESVDALTFALGEKRYLPLLLAAYSPIDFGAFQDPEAPADAKSKRRRAEFRKLLRKVEIFHFRRAVISKASSAELEFVYNKAALALREDRDGGGMAEAEKILAEADVTDEQFKSDFAVKEFNAGRSPENRLANRAVRYILGKMERIMGGTDELRDATIEHILPSHPGDEWDQFFPPKGRENFARRLGNYCFLSEEDNNASANRPYVDKKGVYEKSRYRTARECAKNHSEWTQEEMTKRQERMADLAADIWPALSK